jgi:hypothetical protein
MSGFVSINPFLNPQAPMGSGTPAVQLSEQPQSSPSAFESALSQALLPTAGSLDQTPQGTPPLDQLETLEIPESFVQEHPEMGLLVGLAPPALHHTPLLIQGTQPDAGHPEPALAPNQIVLDQTPFVLTGATARMPAGPNSPFSANDFVDALEHINQSVPVGITRPSPRLGQSQGFAMEALQPPAWHTNPTPTALSAPQLGPSTTKTQGQPLVGGLENLMGKLEHATVSFEQAPEQHARPLAGPQSPSLDQDFLALTTARQQPTTILPFAQEQKADHGLGRGVVFPSAMPLDSRTVAVMPAATPMTLGSTEVLGTSQPPQAPSLLAGQQPTAQPGNAQAFALQQLNTQQFAPQQMNAQPFVPQPLQAQQPAVHQPTVMAMTTISTSRSMERPVHLSRNPHLADPLLTKGDRLESDESLLSLEEATDASPRTDAGNEMTQHAPTLAHDKSGLGSEHSTGSLERLGGEQQRQLTAALHNRIADTAGRMMLAGSTGQAKLTIRDSTLGSIDVMVQVSRAKHVSIELTAGDEEMRQQLEAQVDTLRERLKDENFEVVNIRLVQESKQSAGSNSSGGGDNRDTSAFQSNASDSSESSGSSGSSQQQSQRQSAWEQENRLGAWDKKISSAVKSSYAAPTNEVVGTNTKGRLNVRA